MCWLETDFKQLKIYEMRKYSLVLIIGLIISSSYSLAQKFTEEGEGLNIDFELFQGKYLRTQLIYPEGYEINEDLTTTVAEANQEVALHCTGNNRNAHTGAKLAGGEPGMSLNYVGKKETDTPNGKKLVIEQYDPILKLKVESVYEFFEGTSTMRRYTIVTNKSKKAVGIDYLSSAMINNYGNLGHGSIEDKLLIHWVHNSWKAETQWNTSKPSELGWAENAIFQLSGIFHSNLGSMSTIKELPFAMVENTAVGLTWFWQIEHNGSWHWEMSNYKTVVPENHYSPEYSNPTYIYLGGPDEEHHQAWKELNPGESYQTVPVAVGCVFGGFEEAVEEVTKYRRIACLKPHKDNAECPVIFNDYMNCLFGDPTTEKELPLINAAASAGCDYFVIDAGWYAERNERWWDAVGLWQPGNSRFPNGISEVLDSIKSKGMIPGLWLEIERAGINSPLKDKPDSWFFMRHGKRVIANSSYFLDFRNPDVIKHADEVIDRVVGEYGAGYIKMDYNVNALMGTETNVESLGQGLAEHQQAYFKWLENAQKRHPELVIENCGSGGCRMDYAMLSRNQLQSSSDQTDYSRYPSILVGAMAAVLPEQLAVWSYPLLTGDKYEASFNMVSSMLCRIHQSGHLAELPEESFKMVEEGIEIYKNELAEVIPESIPFFPLGMPSIEDHISPIALGLKTEKADYYAVWRLNGKASVQIPLKTNGEIEILYPVDLGIKLENGNGVCSVVFPETNMAVIVKVTKK